MVKAWGGGQEQAREVNGGKGGICTTYFNNKDLKIDK